MPYHLRAINWTQLPYHIGPKSTTGSSTLVSQRYRCDCRRVLMRNGEYLSPFKTCTFLWMSLVSVSQEFLLFLVKQLSSSNIQSTFLHSDLQWVQQGPAWRQLQVGDSKFYPSPHVQTRASYEIMSWDSPWMRNVTLTSYGGHIWHMSPGRRVMTSSSEQLNFKQDPNYSGKGSEDGEWIIWPHSRADFNIKYHLFKLIMSFRN